MTVRPKSLALFSDEPSSWYCPRCQETTTYDHRCPAEEEEVA